jgi:hypothetical protein
VQPIALDAHGLHVEVHGTDARRRTNGEPAGWDRFRGRDG